MTRPGTARRAPRRSGARPNIEILEGRSLPSGIGFTSALGVGATGKYAAIHSNAVTTDSAGDTFVTGSFRGTAAFDPNSSSSTFTTANTEDAFIAKYSPAGTLVWASTFAGQATTNSGGFTTYATSQGAAIAVDGSGNVFVSGSFNGTVNLTGSTGVSQVSSVASATEPFVAKLDPSGKVTWFDAVAGMAYDTDSATALALDGSGGAVIAGWFAESATFGSKTLTAGGQSDAFVARVNGSGTFLWAVASQGANGSNASVQGLAVDGSGNVDLAGFFSSSVNFDPSSGSTVLTSAGSNDALLWKLNSSGNFLWARSYGSTDYDAATAVAVDASGDLYATGAFSDTVNFGTVARPDSLTAGPVYDAFLLKVDPNGNEVWVKGLVGPSGSSKGQGVAVDLAGNLHVAGTFSGPLDFDPGPGTDTLRSVGSSDAFSAGYDASGNLVYALQAGQTNFNAALGIAVNGSGVVAITGTYAGSIVFGPSTLPSLGVASVFVAWVVTQFPPVAPSAPVLEASSDTGLSHTDGITNATRPVFDVNTAVASDTVELLRNGVVVAQRTGPGALQDPGPLADGTYSYTAVQVSSPFGLTSPASPGSSVTILTVPPAALPAPTLFAADDSGTLGDGITNVKQPRLSVVAGGGLTVQIVNAANAVIGSAYHASAGTIVVSLSQALADGVYPVRAMAVDLAGNVGAAGTAFSLMIDTTPPAAPSIPGLLTADDSGTVGDGFTNVRQPRLTGSAEANSTVQLIDGLGNVDGSGVASGTGAYTIKLNASLGDGAYAIHAVATDAAGNASPSGSAFSLTIDTTAPATPSIPGLLAADDSGTVGDGLTNVRQPRLTGTAEANSTVQLIDGLGHVDGSGVASGSGSYTIKLGTALADGTYAIHAVATDAAGNASPSGSAFSLTIDTTAPAAPPIPSLLAADDSGTVGDGLTNVRQPRLTGTAEANSTVQLIDGLGHVDGSGVASGSGSYTIKLGTALADGTYAIHAVATDAAGNTSPSGSAFSLTIDTTAPAAPPIPSLLAADDSGTVGDGLTNIRQPRLTGTAEANSTVQLIDGLGHVDGSGVASGTGSYTIKLNAALADGAYAIHAAATDAAGNVGLSGPAFSLTVDSTPPAAPPIPGLLAADDSGAVGDGITNFKQPRLTGTAEANSTVQLIDGLGNVDGSGVASGTGAYTIKLNASLADGTYAIHAVATDAAGNLGPSGPAFSLTILATPPAAPSAPTLLAQDDSGTVGDGITNVKQPRLTGTATAGLTIRLVNASNVVIGTATASAGGSVTVSPSTPLADGTYVLDLVAVDAAGNVSVPGGTISLTILATPPPQPAAPTLLTADDTGVAGDGLTSVRRPKLVGTAAPGGRIDWLGANGSVLASTTVSASNGSYQLQLPSASVNGVYSVTVRETDVAGNVSPTSRAFALTIRADPGDDFGDGQTDISAFRTSDAYFFIQKPTTGALVLQQFGGPGDVPINGDFFGNGHNDIAIFRPSNSTFFAFDPVTLAFKSVQFGPVGSVPVPGDYDGDGQTDFAVFVPSTATFMVQMSATNTTYTHQFGGTGDIPVPADYFGNGHADLAFYRPSNSTFYVLDQLTNGIKIVTVGLPNSTPVPADYEGLGHVDPAVYEPGATTFVIQMSATNTAYSRQFGSAGNIPIPGDYIGNGRADLAVYLPGSATFLALDIPTNATRVVAWGTPYVTWPTLAPITTWFTFGGSPPKPSRAPGLSAPAAPDLTLIPLTTDVVTDLSPTRARKSRAIDLAIDSLQQG